MFEKLTNRDRNIVLGIGIALILVYFIPIWYIVLKAPQYRDGLSMSIWLTKITGGTKFDLTNINILNHYVGMRKIDIKDFAEFIYMPYVLGFLILGALVTYIYPRRIMLFLGMASLVGVAVAGLIDFHKWEYEFGHNLDPDAALSIPGINFEPPLIGCKAMMNFNTCSWPHAGGFILFAVGILLAYLIFNELRINRTKSI